MLKGKTAIITGAGRGLGREIALQMAAEGARTVLMSRTAKELQEVAGQIEKQGGKCLVYPGDVSDHGQVHEMVDMAKRHYETVDILINNAAIIGPANFIHEATHENWRKTLAINLDGPYNCCHAVIPLMIQNQAGKIINLTSGLGQRPFPRFCAYGVSKAGIIQLTRSLAEELKSYNIQVNAIDPGVMDTSMQADIRALDQSSVGETVYERFHDLYRGGHLKNPADVATLAVFLASSNADHITGKNGGPADYLPHGLAFLAADKTRR